MIHFKHILCVVFAILNTITASTKKIDGKILSSERKVPLPSAIITIFSTDSIIGNTQTGAKGTFSFNIPDSIRVTLTVTALGFQDKEMSFESDTIKSPLCIMLAEAILSKDLDEFVVEADKSNLVKRTANGQIFYLSGKAKKERNPFMALKEIPLLISDDVNSQVKLMNGSTPLILIDGNRVNSGISPILPADIESVEVVTSVPARYLQEGYNSLINIRLKQNRDPYMWIQSATRHDIPIYKGFGVGYFEIGKEKFSIYGRAYCNYTTGKTTSGTIERLNTGYTQIFDTDSRSKAHCFQSDIMAKFMPSPKDYFALQGYYNHTYEKNSGIATGEYITDLQNVYSSKSSDLDKSTIVTSNLYYKHSFANDNNLEAKISLNLNNNNLDSKNKETIGEKLRDYQSIFLSKRLAGSFDMDYGKSFESGISFSAGNHLSFESDKINIISVVIPAFRHKRTANYLFGSISGQLKNILYMLSGGIEGIWLKAADKRNDYLRPRIAASVTWTPDQKNSLQIDYTLSNQSPDLSMLNPFNTSSDSLIVTSGNPYLTPAFTRNLELTYTFNSHGLYIFPMVWYERINDICELWGYTDKNIYHSTYRNKGHQSSLSYYIGLNYRKNIFNFTSYTGYIANYFQGQSPKWSFYTSWSLDIYYKKLYFNASMTYQRKDFTPYSFTRQSNPAYAQLQINYNFTPDFYVAVLLQNFTGNTKHTKVVHQGSYQYRGAFTTVGKGFMPSILIRYTFRHNIKRKIKLGNNLFKEETGIKLKMQ